MSGLVRDPGDSGQPIRWYRADAIAVGDQELQHSFAVIGERLLRDWPVTEVSTMATADLDVLLAAGPELILIGSGLRQRQLPPPVLYHGLSQGVGIEVMGNDAAARTYNLLLAEDRNVLAAFVLPAI
ncbi:MAG: MTH938/NDUFAF3 family protein [Xanthomonadales bacterium]|nr:MTH938/NDUFAF3 family protein [Xanthomonadales bacterium]